LYLLNVHRFEEINNTLGYGNGNRLLQQIAARLSGIFADRAVVARLGADEFAVLLRDIPNPALVVDGATKIIDSLKPTFYSIVCQLPCILISASRCCPTAPPMRTAS
jgi:diguanylate cyclase (GGDEF)-like protein